MTRVPRACTLAPPNKEAHRATKDEFNRQARQTALLTVALLAALIFGIIVWVGGDWIPGTVSWPPA